MRRKGRIVAVALVLLLGAPGGGLPYWFGLKAEKALAVPMERLARSHGVIVVRHVSERGWLATETESVLRIPGLPFDIVVQHHISHGPLPLDRWLTGEITWRPVRAVVRSHVRLRPPPAAATAARALASAAASLPPLICDTVIHLDGTGTVSFELAAFKSKTERGELDWQGVRGQLRFDAQGKTLDLTARAAGLSLSAAPAAEDTHAGGGVSLGPLSLEARLEQGAPGGYYYGDSRMAVETLAIAPLLEMRGLRLVFAARPDKQNVSLALSYELDSATVFGQALGPARLVVALRRLDAARLARFETELGALARRDMLAEQAALVILGKALELAADLAHNAPELEVSALRLRLGAEEIRGKARFVLDGRRLNVAENPLRLIAALKGEAELAVPARLLARWYLPRVRQEIQSYARRGLISEAELAQLTTERLAQIAEQALPHYLARDEFTRRLRRDGAEYTLQLSVRQGQVLVNDEPWQPRLALRP